MSLGSPAVVLRQGPRGDELAWCRRPLHPAPIAMARRRRTSPARTISTICSTVKPWAIISPQPAEHADWRAIQLGHLPLRRGHVPAAWRSSPARQTAACRMSRLQCTRASSSRPGPGRFGADSGSVSAVVVASASMRERAVFIGSISVWDTIGTLPPSSIEIVTLFRPAYCRVMGRKAPR
jgi:hypothetical protein